MSTITASPPLAAENKASTVLSYAFVSIVFSLGASMAFFAPLMLGVVAGRYALDFSSAGGIVTLEMVFTSTTVFVLARPMSKMSLQVVSIGAAVVALAAQLISCLDLSLGVFILIRVVSGIASGFLYAAAVYWASLHRHGVRMMASAFFLANVLFGVSVGVLPVLIAANGGKIFFYAEVLLFLLPLIIALFSGKLTLPKVPQFVQASEGKQKANWLAIKFLLLCSILSNLAMAMLWTYSESLAQVRGFDAETIGFVLGLTTLFSIGGSILAGVFDRRFGVVVPLTIGLLVGAISGVILAVSQSLSLYVTALFLYGAASFFIMPFVIGSAAALDSEGRAANLVGGAAFFAGAVAPVIGGVLSDAVSADAVGWTAWGACVLAATCVLVVRKSLDVREIQTPQIKPLN